jgi:hypothetical protein
MLTAIKSSPIPTARSSVRSLVRACAAVALATIDRAHTSAVKIATSEWHDDGAEWILRAASQPASLSNAPALVQTIMPDFVATLAGHSAAASVFREGLQLSFGRAGQINVPTILGDPSLAAFVAEGFPIPVVQGKVEPLLMLTPRKLATIVVLTTEMVASSNVETLMHDALTRSVAIALDAALFDANAADVNRPSGLRSGVTALAASTAPDPVIALLNDVEILHDSIEDVTPRDPVYVASPTRALMMDLKSPHGLDPLKIYGSSGLHNSNDVIAIAGPALVSVYGDVPEITASRESALQMDTAPVAGLGAHSVSTWQADLVAIKLRLPVSWGLRHPSGCAWLTALNW